MASFFAYSQQTIYINVVGCYSSKIYKTSRIIYLINGQKQSCRYIQCFFNFALFLSFIFASRVNHRFACGFAKFFLYSQRRANSANSLETYGKIRRTRDQLPRPITSTRRRLSVNYRPRNVCWVQ